MPFISELTQKMKKSFEDMFEKPIAFQKDSNFIIITGSYYIG